MAVPSVDGFFSRDCNGHLLEPFFRPSAAVMHVHYCATYLGKDLTDLGSHGIKVMSVGKYATPCQMR